MMALRIQEIDGKKEVYVLGKRWDTLSAPQKNLTLLMFAGQVLLGIGQAVLLIAALRDLRKRPAEQIKGKKMAWFFIVFIEWVGPIAYFVYGRKKVSE